MTRFSLRRMVAVGLLGALPVLAGCDDESINEPTATAGAMFRRYVAIGNSVTAGYQSGGINDSTQNQSYAKLLADALGTEFRQPLLNSPGCPAPYTNILTGARIAGGATDCAYRKTPVSTVLNNVSVPGAAVLDVLDNLAAGNRANALTMILLGGRTQMEAAAALQPTFATVMIGNNDVLGAALSGNAALVTDAAAFASRYIAMVDEIDALGVEEAVLVGVFNVSAIPHLSPGVAYFLAANTPGAGWPPTYTVHASCAPATLGGVGETTLVPFGYGFGTLMAQAMAGTPVTLNCATDAAVLTGTEIQTVGAAVAAYNQTISAAATAKDWAYFDPNPAMLALKAAGDIPLFPNTTGGAPFGTYFSQDGVHPSLAGHQLLKDSLLAVIQRTYPQ